MIEFDSRVIPRVQFKEGAPKEAHYKFRILEIFATTIVNTANICSRHMREDKLRKFRACWEHISIYYIFNNNKKWQPTTVTTAMNVFTRNWFPMYIHGNVNIWPLLSPWFRKAEVSQQIFRIMHSNKPPYPVQFLLDGSAHEQTVNMTWFILRIPSDAPNSLAFVCLQKWSPIESFSFTCSLNTKKSFSGNCKKRSVHDMYPEPGFTIISHVTYKRHEPHLRFYARKVVQRARSVPAPR